MSLDLNKIKSFLSDNIVATIGKIADSLKLAFQFLIFYFKRKDEKAAIKEEQTAEKKLDDACDNGNLNDLLHASDEYGKKRLCLLISAVLAIGLTGCHSINVTTTEQYEGRYENPAEAVTAIKEIKLKRGESIWILSNTTLKTLLKNTEKH